MPRLFLKTVQILILVIVLSACGGGGGGGGEGGGGNNPPVIHTPSIGDFNIFPTSAEQNQGSGRVQVFYSFNFTDSGGDLSSVTITVYDQANTQLGTATGAIQGASGITSSIISGHFNADTSTLGIFTLDFYVTDAAGSLSNHLTQTFMVAQIPPSFSASVNYPGSVGSYLGNTAVGDLNGDGRNDVAVIRNSGNSIFIYYQNAQGALGAYQTITTDLILKGVAIADVNHDGFADLIVGGDSTTAPFYPIGRVAVCFQDPTTHLLGAPQYYTISIDTVRSLAVADLNGDGLLDIVAAGSAPGTNGMISFLFQNAGGGFNAETTYTAAPVLVTGAELHVADMNHDGLNDIVVQSADLQLAVIKQTSPGIFSNSPDFFTVQNNTLYFSTFALGDLNGDGRTDLVVADPGSGGKLNIFYQNASGSLTGPTVTTLGFVSQQEVHVADLNGDGLNDIILVNGDSSNEVRVLYQRLDHTFASPVSYSTPGGGGFTYQALSVADVTCDGLLDIVTSYSDQGIYVLRRLP